MSRLSVTMVVFALFVLPALTLFVPDAQARQDDASALGTIAYTNGRDLRLIEADGGNDRLIWTVPDTNFSVSNLAWNPDATEIAFASNHEMAISFYERDLYAIRPDGSGLRKLTNAPIHQEVASYPTGTVTVTVQNNTLDAGPYFVYVEGAPEPQQVTIPPFSSTNLTFTEVADLGPDNDQPVVVISGITRWWDAAVAADVEPGNTVGAGSVTITSNSGIEHFGADGAFWRSDGTRLGFFGTGGISGTSTCTLQQVPADPPLGFSYDPIFDPNVFGWPCAADWAPTSSLANQLLVVDFDDYSETGEVHVYRATEGSADRGDLLVTFDGYVLVFDIRWLPDGSGFLVAKHDGLLERGINLHEYSFADGSLRQLTQFTGEEEGVRSFSLSPDGQFVVFEYRDAQEDSTPELWIMRRDGSERQLLAPNGRSPSWSLQNPSVGAAPPEDITQPRSRLAVYPLPVRSEAVLSFHLQKPQDITVKMYDALGREVLVRHIGHRPPGEHKETLDAGGYSAGIYFISIIGSAGERVTNRVIVLK